MTEERFVQSRHWCIDRVQKRETEHWDTVIGWLNELNKENERLKQENNKLHQKIFEMRTNIALDRTEISKQTYTGKKNAKEFLDELKKW